MTSHYRVNKAVKRPYQYSKTLHALLSARREGHKDELHELRCKHNLECSMPNINRSGEVIVRDRALNR